MKKYGRILIIPTLLVLICLLMQGCVGNVLGGCNQREMGQYTSFLTDGSKEYVWYNLAFEDGYVQVTDDSFELCDADLSDIVLSESESKIEVLLSGQANAAFGNDIDAKEGYEYLKAQLVENIEGCEDFEVIILRNDQCIYGAVNCYSRSSGRSGNLLSNEDFVKSYLLEVENEKIKITKDIGKYAVLALNQSHYIAYTDKIFYSIDKETNQKIEICRDIWWDNGPTFYSAVDVSFVDDIFMFCGFRGTTSNTYGTVIVGTINGEHIETLIDDKKLY